MTNLQAIDLLKGLEQSLDDYCELNDEGKTAFGMAITALELFGISEQLTSAQPYTIYSDGRLWITVDDIDKVTAVVVDEHKSKFCKQFYEDAEPDIIRCRNCKFASGDSRICMQFGHSPIGELDFCSFAERREVTT